MGLRLLIPNCGNDLGLRTIIYMDCPIFDKFFFQVDSKADEFVRK